MGCVQGSGKFILVLFNSIFTLLALGLLGVGIFVIVSSDTFFSLLLRANARIGDNQDVNNELDRLSEEVGLIKVAGYTLTGLGAFVLVLAFLGCIGALTKSKCLLTVYCILLAVMASAKVGAVVALNFTESEAFGLVSESLVGLQKYFVSVNDLQKASASEAAASQAIHALHVTLDCCGAASVGDIANSSSWLASNRTWTQDGEEMQIPASCCPVTAEMKETLLTQQQWRNIRDYLEDADCPITREGMHEKTCTKALQETLEVFKWPTFGSVGAIVLLELLMIVLAAIVCCSDKPGKQNKSYVA